MSDAHAQSGPQTPLTPLTPLTPVLAADERFRLLAELVDERFGAIDLSALLVYLVDMVPANVLPHLAGQFHVMGLEGWEFAQTERERRDLIRRAIELHRYKGTPWAIEQVLVTLNLQGVVSEWFDYGGQPYRFKVDVDVSGRGLSQIEYQRLEALILQYKNKRSRLDGLSLTLTARSPVPVVAAALLAGEVITVYPYHVAGLEQASPVPGIAAGHWSIETVSVFPYHVAGLEQASPVPGVGAGHWSVETVSVYPRTA